MGFCLLCMLSFQSPRLHKQTWKFCFPDLLPSLIPHGKFNKMFCPILFTIVSTIIISLFIIFTFLITAKVSSRPIKKIGQVSYLMKHQLRVVKDQTSQKQWYRSVQNIEPLLINSNKLDLHKTSVYSGNNLLQKSSSFIFEEASQVKA